MNQIALELPHVVLEPPLDVLKVPFQDPFTVVNTIGLIAFALVGSLKAIREKFDVIDITIVGLAMAFAGGVSRDVLVARTPLALQSPLEIILGLSGVCLAILLSVILSSLETDLLTLVADTTGLAAFATAGAIVATETGVPAFGIVSVATINAAGGGVVANILLGRPPFTIFEDFYAICAVFGGAAYWLMGLIGASGSAAAGTCVVVTVGMRLTAVKYDWNLPTVGDLC